MSASADLQQAITTRLALAHTEALGNGVLTEFTIAHNLGMVTLPAVTISAGSTLLVQGTDYELELIDEDTLKIVALGAPPAAAAWSARVACLRVKMQAGTPTTWTNDAVPIVARRAKEIANDIEAAAAKHGLGIYVMPPLATKAMQGVPFVFVEEAEVAIRIIEQPAGNKFGVDAYDLVDDVMTSLQWQLLGGQILAHPLQLASRPTEMAEDRKWRIIDVKFTATYGFKGAVAGI